MKLPECLFPAPSLFALVGSGQKYNHSSCERFDGIVFFGATSPSTEILGHFLATLRPLLGYETSRTLEEPRRRPCGLSPSTGFPYQWCYEGGAGHTRDPPPPGMVVVMVMRL